MRKIYLIMIILSSLICIQCNSAKNVTGTDQLSSAIKGEWKIEHEVCCGRISETTYGGNKSIQFNTKKSTYTIYKGTSVEKKGKYTLETQEIGTMIRLDDRHPAIIRITDGKLFIDWSYMDLSREVYTR